jgi:hypothetical protein
LPVVGVWVVVVLPAIGAELADCDPLGELLAGAAAAAGGDGLGSLAGTEAAGAADVCAGPAAGIDRWITTPRFSAARTADCRPVEPVALTTTNAVATADAAATTDSWRWVRRTARSSRIVSMSLAITRSGA